MTERGDAGAPAKRYPLGGPREGALSGRIDYDRELNDEQRAVVFAGDGAILVIAGAGSGKTRTITYRVARLVETGVPPPTILLVTFTNKAAREMLRRVERLLGTDLRPLWGGTFHHVGHLVLRSHAELVGLPKNFTILDREDSKELVEQIAASRRKLARFKKFPKGDVLENIYSFSRNTGESVGKIIQDRYPVFFEIQDEIQTVFREYGERKRKNGQVDFDDLLILWKRLLLEFPDVRAKLSARFRHILVDEYQDTNKLQAEIVETMAGPAGNLMVVGDDAQSIYSFRGANFGNIIDFPRRYPNAKQFRLEQNYRSTPEVLDLANSVLRHNTRQFPKALRTVRPSGPRPEWVATGSPAEQARFVVERLLALQEEGLRLEDMAVLYRAHWHSMEIQMELQSRGIPFQVRSGIRFFEQAHVKDVVSFLRLTANPRDELSWRRLLKLYPGVGRGIAEKVWRHVEEASDPFAAVFSKSADEWVPRAARPGWGAFRKLLAKVREVPQPGEAIRTVLDEGYEDILTANFANGALRADDVRRMADFALRHKDIPSFLAEVTLDVNLASEDSFEEPEPTDVLVLSTVHQAKGLEWRAVLVPWLVEGKFPDARSLREEGGEEEERRLFYVAVTRAKDRLYLVSPQLAEERGMWDVIQSPSRFLREIDPATVEKAVAGAFAEAEEEPEG